MRRDMQEAESSDSPEFVEFREKSSRFLQKASLLLMSLIAESGRDRFCYVKEALIHPDATCSRPAPLTSTNLSRRKHVYSKQFIDSRLHCLSTATSSNNSFMALKATAENVITS